ncbi:hypothetical protein BD413DRAFT_538670 [Trametes elegans]|nr:hypothetical protein BD413DRAFT_538670 [Trametes elegans]
MTTARLRPPRRPVRMHGDSSLRMPTRRWSTNIERRSTRCLSTGETSGGCAGTTPAFW